jgi:hypothetical protein
VTFPASTPCWYDSTEAGAPTLNNAAGSLLEVLRSCLINGFGAVSVTSIVVAGGVATATAATHGFSSAYGKLVLVEGAPVAELNGRKRIGNVLTNTFTFPAPGVADGTYTGTISAKRAPLGWTEAHTGTNKAIFARSDPAALTQLLRVDDSNSAPATALDARVLMVESATDVDTFVNPSPTNAQVSGGGYWHKGQDTTAAKRWALVGTSRGFYFFLPAQNVASPSVDRNAPMFFGDGVPYRIGDSHFCLLGASNNTLAALGFASTGMGRVVNFNAGGPSAGDPRVARSRNGVNFSPNGMQAGPNAGSLIGRDGQTATDIIVIHSPIWFQDDFSASREIRGEVPGLAAPLANQPYVASGAFHVVDSVANTDRVYLSCMVNSGSSLASNVLIDLTGPWY